MPKWSMPGTRLGPPQKVKESIAQWRPDGESLAWKIKTDLYRSKAATDVWGRRFFFAGEQGMEFLGIFLEILFRRARDIFEFKYFLSKVRRSYSFPSAGKYRMCDHAKTSPFYMVPIKGTIFDLGVAPKKSLTIGGKVEERERELTLA